MATKTKKLNLLTAEFVDAVKGPICRTWGQVGGDDGCFRLCLVGMATAWEWHRFELAK